MLRIYRGKKETKFKVFKVGFNITIPFSRQVIAAQGRIDRTLH